MGVITKYKYNMLPQDEQEGGKDGENMDLTMGDRAAETPDLKRSDNKDRRSMTCGGPKVNNLVKGDKSRRIEKHKHTK